MRRVLVSLVAVCAVGFFATDVWAQEINACAKKANGQLRIVESPENCNNSENHLTWNVMGPPGEQGLQGDPGATGPGGLNGANGLNGTDGTNGLNGTHGEDGQDGQDGAPGPPGPAAPKYVYVGLTTGSYQGDRAEATFNNLCEDNYEGSRFCTSEDLRATPGFYLAGASQAWVRPVYLDGQKSVEISGFENRNGNDGNMSCNGWTSNASTDYGFAIGGTQRWFAPPCHYSMQATCCAPLEE